MLKSLLYRRALWVLDGVLVVFLVVSLVLAARALITRDANVSLAGVPAQTGPDDEIFGPVKPRSAYDELLKSGLFGVAGQRKGEEDSAPPPVPTTAEVESQLPIRLFGTVFAGIRDPLATALMEVRDGGTRTQAFYVGERVMDGVFLREVRYREVILENTRVTPSRMEVLKKEEEGPTPRHQTTRVMPTLSAERPVTRATPEAIRTLDRADIVAKLEENYEQLAAVEVQEVTDDDGNVIGLTTDNVGNLPLAGEFGLQDGDVLTDVNNIKVNSVEKIEEVIEKYKRATTFRLGLLRNGQPTTIYYRLR